MSIPFFFLYRRYWLYVIWWLVSLPGADNIRREITLEIVESVSMAGVQLLHFASECAVPNYYVASLRLESVEGRMLFRLPNPVVNVLSHFVFFKIMKEMFMNTFFWR